MKKKLIIIVTILLLLMVGCFKKEEVNVEETPEPKLNTLANIHYQPLEVEEDSTITQEMLLEPLTIEGIDEGDYTLSLKSDLPDSSQVGKQDFQVEIDYKDGSNDFLESYITIVDKTIYSHYSGLPIERENENIRPVMIMIDNNKYARPQANLSKASIIWEMRVEGGSTRYLALFEKPTESEFLVGPIRSARPNFVEVANNYNGLYGHHGGSTDGINFIHQLGLNDFDGMHLEGSLFFRYFDTGKFAPHNSYVELNQVYEYAQNKGWDLTDSNEGFLFNPSFTPLENGVEKEQVTLTYDPSMNIVEFKYQPDSETYHKYREGQLMVDELTQTPVEVSNIIIQVADSYVYDVAGHKAFHLTGEGKGYYLTGGQMIDITWSKPEDHTVPTKFYTLEGDELSLNSGQTWIQVIDSWMDTQISN